MTGDNSLKQKCQQWFMLIKVIMTKEMSDYMVMWMPDIHVHVLTYKNLV